MTVSGPFTVTGPDCDRRAESAGVGLSAAVTCASRASRSGLVASYYVRDPSGLLVGRADADETGCVQVLGERALRANGNADRASASGAAAALVDGRPGSPRRPDEGGEMAKTETKTKRAPRARKKAAQPSPEPEAPAEPEAPPAADATPAADMAAAAERVSAKQATVRVLERADGPLRADEIAKRVLKTRGVALAGKTPAATIAAMLSVENKKPDGLFVRVDKGTYALRAGGGGS